MTQFHPLDYLATSAGNAPDSLAIADTTNAFTYSHLAKLVANCGTQLRGLGIKPGDVCAIQLSPLWEWVFTLAAMHEAAIACSAIGIGESLPFEIDYLITDHSESEIEAENVILIDQAWINSALELPLASPRNEYDNDECVCAIILTSGTTGQAKGAAITLETISSRMALFPLYWTDNLQEMCLMGLSTISGFMAGFIAANNGTCFITVSNINLDAVNLANRLEVKGIIASNMQIDAFSNLLRESKTAIPTVRRIRLAGSVTTLAVFSSTKDSFNAEVRSIYGSTELGGITQRTITYSSDTFEAGTIDPWAQVEIVDEDNIVLETGFVGLVRAKSIGQIPGYFRDPIATDSQFVDGWFYTGDTGFITEDGRLYLSGRVDELINVGGKKLDPNIIDQFAMTQPGVLDVATVRIERSLGQQEIGLAVITNTEYDPVAMQSNLQNKFAVNYSILIIEVATIPRNEMGKINRANLENLIQSETSN